jgi:hypothetical protein
MQTPSLWGWKMTRILRWVKLGEPIPDGPKFLKWETKKIPGDAYDGPKMEEQYLYEVPIETQLPTRETKDDPTTYCIKPTSF